MLRTNLIRLISIVATVFWTQASWSKVQLTAVSAAREWNQSYTEAAHANLSRAYKLHAQGDTDFAYSHNSAFSASKKIHQVVWANTATWSDQFDMQTVFRKITDERVLKHADYEEPSRVFNRRPSWLYPDDGCFARAEVMAHRLESMGLPKPTKIFVFGNLMVNTPNSPAGSVGWWFHVTVAYQYKGTVYVFDPALEPLFPLTAKDWIARMEDGVEGVSVSLCSRGTYSPDSSCDSEETLDWPQAITQQSYYLDAEWVRLDGMNRNPREELGDNPPWKK